MMRKVLIKLNPIRAFTVNIRAAVVVRMIDVVRFKKREESR